MNKLPAWLILHIWQSLLGEIYPAIRAIAAEFVGKTLLIRYYLERAPTEFDVDSAEVLSTNIYASAGSDLIERINVECIYATLPFKDLDPLSGFVYCRREYDIEIP
ncbi:colicin [Rhizobium ruizarguesonis]|uniref:Colicin n=1 Tax=Rhizobium ruizarguesonis TaxID=2081791 RepID=A0ABY1X001_9HYPH|nr:colicin [Rhizobium ruizarguesonis]TAU37363.1 colicin [Rhizobium ruizarguesonis]TAU46269.1 colicin [Rhizobium ruizarguesonis]TAU71729.1 colicin [Rhizobium ruizarguesonis]TAV23867.1 colicin [Rhizobium ruizarguesonis]TAV24912.1 colicin [Rhizobium ruizarguesonis]